MDNDNKITRLFTSSLSLRIVLWVFFSVIVIEAIILIPFVDEQALLTEEAKMKSANDITLTDAETERNGRGSTFEFHSDETEESKNHQFESYTSTVSTVAKPQVIDYFTWDDLILKSENPDLSVSLDFPSLHHLKILKVLMKKTKKMSTTFDIPHIAITPPKEVGEEAIVKWTLPFIG